MSDRKIKEITKRVNALSDIAILVFRVKGPCSYNPAHFDPAHLVTGEKRFWYETDKDPPTLEELEKEDLVYRKELGLTQEVEVKAKRGRRKKS